MLPLFLTIKYAIKRLNIRIFDFQLRDHYRKINHIYVKNCDCANHSHKKIKCPLTSEPSCSKCGKVASLYMPYYVDLFHNEIPSLGSTHELCIFRCNKHHTHTHFPPCNECLSCRIGEPCIIRDPVECEYAVMSVCFDESNNCEKSIVNHPHEDIMTTLSSQSPSSSTSLIKGNRRSHSRIPLEYNEFIYEHLFETNILFYICLTHKHVHKRSQKYRIQSASKKNDRLLLEQEHFYDTVFCYVQSTKCCDDAVLVTDYNHSFMITQTSEFIDGPISKSASNYVIYDPTLWKEQTKNQFISLLKAVLLYPNLISDRYNTLEESNYKVGNINKHKSGNHSGVRIKITGFDTRSIFQTATISSELSRDVIYVPQQLYDSLGSVFDFKFGLIKRDPAINCTCLYVVRIIRNDDPDVQTITINHHIAKGLNQDQDGDKNVIFFLSVDKGTYSEKVARYEIAAAFNKEKTLLCENRYSFSENTRLLIYRHADWLKERSEFFRKTYTLGLTYMLEAGHGFLQNEYREFCNLIDELNRRNDYVVTFDDICGKTNLINSIVDSEAKGHKESIEVFKNKLFSSKKTFDDAQHQEDSKKQMERYINSSMDVRNIGRESFILINGQQDMKIAGGTISINNFNYANILTCSGILTFLNNYASFDQLVEALLDASSFMDLEECAMKNVQ